jgi:hypothetical protein
MVFPPRSGCWLTLPFLICALLSPLPSHARVVLIGIDGGSWNLIEPMLKAGELPNLGALAERGVMAPLQTVEPDTSPVIWTSVATGRRTDTHGTTDSVSTRLGVRVPRPFERLAAMGVRVGLYDYLVTWPPAPLPGGFVMPGWLRKDGSVSPPDVWAHIDLPAFTTHSKNLRPAEDDLQRASREVSLKAGRWNQLAKSFDVEVGAVTFYAADMTSHRFRHVAFPEDFEGDLPAPDPDQRTALAEALRGIDRGVGEIVDTLGPNDVVMIASDRASHANPNGSRSVWVTRFNQALARAGLDAKRDGFAVVSSFGAVIIRVQPGEFAQREATVDRLVALLDSYTTQEGDPLLLVSTIDVADRPVDAQGSLWSRLRQWTARLVIRYWFDVQIDPLPPHAVVFAMPISRDLDELWPEGSVRVLGETMPIQRAMNRHEFTDEHDETGIFLAAGGPIRAGVERSKISVPEVAPLLFYLSDQPIPDDLPGQLPRDILAPEVLAENPPRTARASNFPDLPEGPEVEAISDPDLVERIRSLGNLE